MTSALRKPLVSVASALLRSSVSASLGARQRLLTAPFIAKRGSGESLGTLARRQHGSLFQNVNSKTGVMSCSFAGMHSEVDKELSEFLSKEIALEQKIEHKSPQLSGWSLTKNGSEVEMTRKHKNDEVKIKMNINLSVDNDIQETGEEEETSAKMVSRPDFSVEIKKFSGKVLFLQCCFVHPGDQFVDEGEQGEEKIDDMFEIQEVSIPAKEWNDQAYLMTAETMDGTLYDLLMDMLDERGVTDDFVMQLEQFCTSYEHGQYVSFLKDLKTVMEE